MCANVDDFGFDPCCRQWRENCSTILSKHELAISVTLPVGLPLLRSAPLLAGSSGRLPFKLEETVEIPPGSPAHLALVAAMEADDASRAEVRFTLAALAEDRERELGSTSLNLHEVRRRNEDFEDLSIEVQDARRGEAVGKLRVSLKALKAIRRTDETIRSRKLHASRLTPDLMSLIHSEGDVIHDTGFDLMAFTSRCQDAARSSLPDRTAFPVRSTLPSRDSIAPQLLKAQPEQLAGSHAVPLTGSTAVSQGRNLAQRNASVIGDIESDRE